MVSQARALQGVGCREHSLHPHIASSHLMVSHGRGEDHEVVGGTTTTAEEEDDEEPEEEAAALEAVRFGDGS